MLVGAFYDTKNRTILGLLEVQNGAIAIFERFLLLYLFEVLS